MRYSRTLRKSLSGFIESIIFFASLPTAGVGFKSPVLYKLIDSIHNGSEMSVLPILKASVLFLIATPLILIASSIEVASIGIAPD